MFKENSPELDSIDTKIKTLEDKIAAIERKKTEMLNRGETRELHGKAAYKSLCDEAFWIGEQIAHLTRG